MVHVQDILLIVLKCEFDKIPFTYFIIVCTDSSLRGGACFSV